MKRCNKNGKITRLVTWLEENKIIRKLAIFWIIWLITVVVLNTTNPLILGEVNSAVASIVISVIGVFTVAMNALIKGDKED